MKAFPDYTGRYKGMVMEWGITKSKAGLPQFTLRVYLTEYYDVKEKQWYDVGDNNWSMVTFMSLYGRKDSKPDGELITTLNHQQVCEVFSWDGCGFTYLTTPGTFEGKIIQVQIDANDPEYAAKNPVQITWIYPEDADPTGKLRTLEAKDVKELEAEFASMWMGKKAVKAVSAPATAAPKAAPKATPKATLKPAAKPTTPAPAAAPVPAPEATAADDAAAKKAALLAKSKRLMATNKKAETPAPKVTAKPPVKKAELKPTPELVAEPEETAAETETSGIPDDYNKRQAWLDICDLKSPDCVDETLNAAWEAAIAEVAPDGDEDKLDAAGWFAVKDKVLAEVGAL
jgi:hypothetical protein